MADRSSKLLGVAIVVVSIAALNMVQAQQQQRAYACGGPNNQCAFFVNAAYVYSSASPHYWLYNIYYDYVYNQYGNLDHVTADKYWWYNYNYWPFQAGYSGTYWGDQTYYVCSNNPYINNVPYCGAA